MSSPQSRRIGKSVGRIIATLLILIAALFTAAATSLIPVFVGAENAAIGRSTYFGLPFPYRKCAPGLAWCQFYRWPFFLDLFFWCMLISLVCWIGLRFVWRKVKRAHSGDSDAINL